MAGAPRQQQCPERDGVKEGSHETSKIPRSSKVNSQVERWKTGSRPPSFATRAFGEVFAVTRKASFAH